MCANLENVEELNLNKTIHSYQIVIQILIKHKAH